MFKKKARIRIIVKKVIFFPNFFLLDPDQTNSANAARNRVELIQCGIYRNPDQNTVEKPQFALYISQYYSYIIGDMYIFSKINREFGYFISLVFLLRFVTFILHDPYLLLCLTEVSILSLLTLLIFSVRKLKKLLVRRKKLKRK
jgi:hypothetical protein